MLSLKNFPIEKFQFKSESILEGLPKKDLDGLFSKMVLRTVKKNQALFIEGTYPSGIFYLKKGKIKKYKIARDGRIQIIYLCTDGELLGYPAVLSEEVYSDSASAIEDSKVGFIATGDFLNVLNQSPSLSRQLLKNMSHEFSVLENNISMFAHKTVRERVAVCLLILMVKFHDKEKINKPVEIILSREDLANIVGIAVETLVRLLHELKEIKVIETKGRIIRILNSRMLAKLTNY